MSEKSLHEESPSSIFQLENYDWLKYVYLTQLTTNWQGKVQKTKDLLRDD